VHGTEAVNPNTPSRRWRLAAPPIDLGWSRSHTPALEEGGSADVTKIPRKEVIQPHLPVRLPCYDFTPVTDPTLDSCLRSRGAVGPPASGVVGFHGVTGGVYKARERIHRGVLTRGY
jgi:hypothetical protein